MEKISDRMARKIKKDKEKLTIPLLAEKYGMTKDQIKHVLYRRKDIKEQADKVIKEATEVNKKSKSLIKKALSFLLRK
tara:strand:+ start:564 stop:797 length:234 start_codon:yes stop_codon:yes gene_type:complete